MRNAWGICQPRQFLNVDQNPFPFVMGTTKTYDHTDSSNEAKRPIKTMLQTESHLTVQTQLCTNFSQQLSER